jgi:hypothetical protein
MLHEIQAKLKAPKGQTNKFGGYKYRSCEDIVEAVKPILKEYEYSLIISDEMIMLGDRFYVKATATLMKDGAIIYMASAYAREAEDKKGMDQAQITGSASSYARKYALNGLFAIDDTKDPDTQDNRESGHRFKPGEKDEIHKQVTECLQNGDGHGLKQILDEYDSEEEKIKIWTIFNSTERSAIKELLK